MWTGITPTEMVTFQEQYYLQIGSKRTSKKWALTFIGKMIVQPMDLGHENLDEEDPNTLFTFHGNRKQFSIRSLYLFKYDNWLR